jgi:ABC-type uncharacterized transport system permease subunit
MKVPTFATMSRWSHDRGGGVNFFPEGMMTICEAVLVRTFVSDENHEAALGPPS